MTDIICPLCGKPNPPELDECKFCQAPLKTGGFIAPPEGEQPAGEPISPPGPTGKEPEEPAETGAPSSLEQAIPDWLKATEASFLEGTEAEPAKAEPGTPSSDQLAEQLDALLNPPPAPPKPREPAIDDEWLASLLAEAGAGEPEQPPSPAEPLESLPLEGQESEFIAGEEFGAEQGAAPGEAVEVEPMPEEEQPGEPTEVEKPDWLTSLEASSNLKMEAVTHPIEEKPQEAPATSEPAPEEAKEPQTPPEWLKKGLFEEPTTAPQEPEGQIAPAELPSWLEALRPKETTATPSGPAEDVSAAEIVTAGPLVGLRGVISASPSAIRAQKPPSYSIKLKVTDEQRTRVEMMQELLADEEKPAPLPSKPAITSQHIFRIIVAVALLLPVVWMIISKSQQTSTPQPGEFPGLVDFTQQIQRLPSLAPVLIAFDYEAGFSGEMNTAISNVITQLMNKRVFLTLVSTNPSGPPLAESMISTAYTNSAGKSGSYGYVTDLGYIPGGTMGLLGLATSPRSILPYSLNGYNVWAGAPLNDVTTIKDFNAVIVITNDPDTARIWIEQVGPPLKQADKPLLVITSSQAEPLIRPYYEATPSQVQGLVAGLAGGVAYGRTMGNIQQNGVWDAYSIGVTISILIILVGSIAGGVVKMTASEKKES